MGRVWHKIAGSTLSWCIALKPVYMLSDKIRFASVEKARELLSQEDSFTRSWSPFDIDSRLEKQHSSRAEMFDHIRDQVREWTPENQKHMLELVRSIDHDLQTQGFQIRFPEEIYFVKTTAKEEGQALAYTRGSNIVFKEDLKSAEGWDFKRLIAHELFHVLTRNNPEFRKKMYEIIGFRMMPDLDYPPSLRQLRITNPDAPQTDSYISLQVADQPVDCMMILYADREYPGTGSLFDYLRIGFLRLTDQAKKEVYFEDGKPVIYPMNKVGHFFEQVGKNTDYTIHPEEIMADNFSFAVLGKVDMPDQWILEAIKKNLRSTTV